MNNVSLICQVVKSVLRTNNLSASRWFQVFFFWVIFSFSQSIEFPIIATIELFSTFNSVYNKKKRTQEKLFADRAQ